jgi:uncharacterized damage-inducible protein DinB
VSGGVAIAELFDYQAWADAKIMAAVKAHAPRFAETEALFAETALLAPSALANMSTDHLLQTVLHSQHHRGQISTRLRALGGAPPTFDYIIWKKKDRT